MKKIICMIILLMCFTLTGCGAKEFELDLLEYITVEFNGNNGNGLAQVDFDSDRLKSYLQDLSSDFKNDDLDLIIKSISVSLDNAEDLTNEDTINAMVKWDDELAGEHNIKFTGNTKNFQVIDLTDKIFIDLFKDIELIFEKISPNSSVLIQNKSTDSELKDISYLSNSSNVANGDTITIKAIVYPGQFDEEKYIVGEKEKDFIVSGADEYVKNFEDIDDSTKEKLIAQADDVLTTHFSKFSTYVYTIHKTYSTRNYDESSVEIISKPIINSHFASYKEGLDTKYWIDHNSLYLVYEMTVIDSKLTEPVTIYPVIQCVDFIKRGSGEIYFELGDVEHFETYKDLDTLKADIVDKNKAKFNFEDVNL